MSNKYCNALYIVNDKIINIAGMALTLFAKNIDTYLQIPVVDIMQNRPGFGYNPNHHDILYFLYLNKCCMTKSNVSLQ